MEKLPGRVRRSGVGLGAFVDSAERAAWAHQLGYRFLAVVPDVILLARAAAAATEPISKLGLN
jgi:2-keto-3-deoxy-L-rhamnonate aldolase RhmA